MSVYEREQGQDARTIEGQINRIGLENLPAKQKVRDRTWFSHRESSSWEGCCRSGVQRLICFYWRSSSARSVVGENGGLCLWGDLRGAVDITITPLLSALSSIILPGHHGNTPRWHCVLREEEGFCRLDCLSLSNEIQSIFWSIFHHTFLHCQV